MDPVTQFFAVLIASVSFGLIVLYMIRDYIDRL